MHFLASTGAAALLSLMAQAAPPRATLLLGLNADQSERGRLSYRALFDAKEADQKGTSGAPLRTLVLFRDGEEVRVESVPALAIPGEAGFRFMVLSTREANNPGFGVSEREEYFGERHSEYRLESSITKPELVGRPEDVRIELNRRTTSGRAVRTEYSAPVWVTSRFYVTEGMAGLVTGGAAAFRSEETCTFVSLSIKCAVKDNGLRAWVTAASFRSIVVAAADSVYRRHEGSKELLAEPTQLLPDGTKVEDLAGVSFSLEHRDGALRFLSVVPLGGYRGKQFNVVQPLKEWPVELAKALGVAPPATGAPGLVGEGVLDAFLSPDGSTMVVLRAGAVEVLDHPSQRRLAVYELAHDVRFVVMEEWALGGYAKRWADALHQAAKAIGGTSAP